MNGKLTEQEQLDIASRIAPVPRQLLVDLSVDAPLFAGLVAHATGHSNSGMTR